MVSARRRQAMRVVVRHLRLRYAPFANLYQRAIAAHRLVRAGRLRPMSAN